MLPVQVPRPTPFEVRCERCRVTFPIGTRRCVHCGGRIGGSLGRLALRVEPPERAPEEFEAEPEPEIGQRRFVSPLTLVWIVLIAAGYLVRACSGEGP